MNNILPDYPNWRSWLSLFLWVAGVTLSSFCIADDHYVASRPILGDVGSSVAIPEGTATKLFFDTPRVGWNNNLKNFKLNYLMFIRPEDYNKKGYTFLAFRKCSQQKLQDIMLYGRDSNDTQAPMQWSKYDPDHELVAYSGKIINANTKKDSPEPILLMRYFMATDDDSLDISSLAYSDYSRECGQFFAGYGLGETTTEAFNEMLGTNRFEMIFDTVLGVRALGSYRLEIKAISFAVDSTASPMPLCPSSKEVDIGCP